MPRRWFHAMAALAAPIIALAIPTAPVSANPGVNPSLTITALAERAMSRIPAKA